MELIFDGDLCLNKEDSSFEAKSAIGGIPLSMWESYSSFANSFGGTIVLGLDETEDGALIAKGVKNTDKVMNEIWNTLNNPQKVSCNILMADDIGIVEHNGKRLISVRVRRADRHDRPIYINDNPLGGTFRRNGPNDYRCTRPEVAEMMRDNVDTPLDAAALDGFDMDDIDRGTLAGYRMLMKLTDENHMWNRVQDDEFLKLIGAVKKGDDGRPHPTLAGLLMFGMEHRITCEVPNYKLDYIEYMDSGVKWEYRIVSGDGRWSGNVFDFYSNVTNRLHVSIGRPFVIGNDWRRVENTDTDKAIREALINALIHADHRGRMGVRVELRPDSFIVRNPGLFRISVKEAEEGGRSDPRNHTLAKMFSLIGAVERVGSGLYRIIETWKKNGFEPPTIQESLNPPTVKLILSMKVDSRTSAIPNEEKVLRLIAEDGSISIEKIARKTVMSKSKTDTIIKKLREDGRIERTGGKKGGYWLIR